MERGSACGAKQIAAQMEQSMTSVYHQRIRQIEKSLSPLNLNKFRSSCFGSFLELQEIGTHGGLMSLIVKSMVKDCIGERRLSFHIHDTQLHFGTKEFYCLTGQKFKHGSKPRDSSAIHDKVFDGKLHLKFIDIKHAFEERCKQEAGTGSTVLKMSLLYMLYGVILYRGYYGTQVDTRHVHVVDDIDKFNAYHWGTIAYDIFISFTQSLSKRAMVSKKPNVLSEVQQHGLCFVLQIWAFKVMPGLSLWHWAMQRRLFSRISLRMLRWAVMPYPVSVNTDFKLQLSARDMINLTPIRASEEEAEAWDVWGIHFTGEECVRVYSSQPLPRSISDSVEKWKLLEDTCSAGNVPLPAWDKIVANCPNQEWRANGMKYLIKEIYGKIDEAIISVWRKDHGLFDLSNTLNIILRRDVAENIGPSTPSINRAEKRRRS